ncbi:MAG: hypothetical protein IAE80_21645, partial [Anaerolinea sp.]|nr:hypothetical protein [Anaerolinea sp.]
MDGNRTAVTQLARIGRNGLILLPPAFLLIFFFYPLISIFAVSFADGSNGFAALVETDYFARVFLFTTGQAALSTLLSLLLGTALALALLRRCFPGRELLLALLTTAAVAPTIVIAFGVV